MSAQDDMEVGPGAPDRGQDPSATDDANGMVAGEVEERERYRELLEEHRTILPGVQVLFAFLLTAIFTQRFQELDGFGRNLYAASLVGTALATILLLAPMSYHRIAPRRRRADRLRTGIQWSVAGTFVLAVSILDAVFVVLRFVFGSGVALTVVAGLSAVVLVVWYLVPMRARITHDRDRPPAADDLRTEEGR